MRRMPIPYRLAFPLNAMQHPGLWGISPHFYGLYPCRGQVAYVLLTSAPVADRRIATPSLPLDLHVLSLSLAFILSQDQTLRCSLSCLFSFSCKKAKNQDSLSLLFAFTARLVGGARPILTMTANESAVTGLTQVSRADALPFPATLAGRRGGLRLVNLLRIEQRLACFSADLLLYYSLSLL